MLCQQVAALDIILEHANPVASSIAQVRELDILTISPSPQINNMGSDGTYPLKLGLPLPGAAEVIDQGRGLLLGQQIGTIPGIELDPVVDTGLGHDCLDYLGGDACRVSRDLHLIGGIGGCHDR